jgi:biopolymer transport protein ExbD
MKRRELLTPDITPLIDVVFILLIFFLVSSTFKKDEKALDLMLPKSSSAIKVIKKEQITIELNRNSLAYKGKKIDFDELDRILKDIKDKSQTVNIRIDKKVLYQRVVKLFDLLKGNDLNNLALEIDMVK